MNNNSLDEPFSQQFRTKHRFSSHSINKTKAKVRKLESSSTVSLRSQSHSELIRRIRSDYTFPHNDTIQTV